MAKATKPTKQQKARPGANDAQRDTAQATPTESPLVTFVGDTGPGAVINQYLPQPSHHTGRRIIRIEDTPKSYWRDEASEIGTRWADYLGLEKGDDDTWDVRKPELLASAWFGAWAARRPSRVKPAIRQLQVEVTASAQEVLATTGSLRNWVQGRAGSWPRGGGSGSQALLVDGDGKGTKPKVSDKKLGRTDDAASTESTNEVDEASSGFQASLARLESGIVDYPTTTWGGGVTEAPVDVNADPEPALFLIQVVGISSFLGDYGLGKTVKTFSLLPGETTAISTRTWRATEESKALASSIIDSYDESSSERFAETVMNETTDTATQEKTENWYVEAEAKGSIGVASAKVSGGGGGEYGSSTEEFSKAVDESVAEHAAEASSHRQNEVTSSSESSVATEDEEVTERSIKNINVSRTLNFTFRELNQAYITKTHLKDLRIAFTNGSAESWREEPISGLRKLVEEVIKPQHVDEVCSDIIKTIAIVRDIDGTPVPILEQVRLDKCAVSHQVRDAEPNKECDYPAPRADGRLYYRFKRGALAQPADEAHPVEGVLLKERQIMLATDSVVAEALLGAENALDDYSEDLQAETIRSQRLAADREALAQQIVAGNDTARAELFAQVFGVPQPEEEETA